MNTHKNARLTFARRLEMVQDITERGLSVPEAAASHGVTAPTAHKWLGRYLVSGAAALADASSRPACSPRAIDAAKALLSTVPRYVLGLRLAAATTLRIPTAAARLSMSRLCGEDRIGSNGAANHGQ